MQAYIKNYPEILLKIRVGGIKMINLLALQKKYIVERVSKSNDFLP